MATAHNGEAKGRDPRDGLAFLCYLLCVVCEPLFDLVRPGEELPEGGERETAQVARRIVDVVLVDAGPGLARLCQV